jgi:alpha-N-arabinofuranosidase
MVALQNDDFWYFLAVGRDHGNLVIRLRRRAGSNDPQDGTILASAPLEYGPVELRISASGASYDFDWSSDGRRWHALAHDADGTVLSTKRAGGFVGAVFGLYVHDGQEKRR